MSRPRGSYREEHYAATLEEIGAHFGRTKEWARQELNKALSKLRESGELHEFKDMVNR